MKWIDRLSLARRQALLIVLACVGCSLLWIPITDQLRGWLLQNPTLLAGLAPYKGMVYVGLAALMFYTLIALTFREAPVGVLNRSASPPRREGIGPLVILFGLAILAVSLTSLPWMIFTKMDQAKTSASLALLAWIDAGIGILVLGLFGFLLLARWHCTRALARVNEEQLHLEKNFLDQRLQSLSQYANDIVLLMDEEGRILDANDRALDAYGYTSEETKRLHIKDLRTLDASGDFSGQFRKVKAQGAIRFETTHVRKDGSCFPVEVSSRGFNLEGALYVQSIIRDISDRKAAEARMRQQA